MILQLPPTLPAQTPLLVAYSGGADSQLLLFLAKAYGETHKVPVYAAHLHHGIRGEEADRDLDFCRRTATQWQIPLFEKRVDIPALARHSGKSQETEAREQRYAFFREIMAEHHLPLLLTAHHADDQLETLLQRFLRGSGTKGMGGIPPLRSLEVGAVWRPLLHLTKAEILEACRAYGLDYVTDSTNLMADATRNRIRQQVIPVLEDVAGRGIPQKAALRLSHHAGEDEDCLSGMAQALYAQIKRSEGISPEELSHTHPAIAKRVLGLAYTQAAVTLTGAPPDHRHTLSAYHLEQLLSFCSEETSSASLTLPLLTATRYKGILSFRLHEPEDEDLPTPLYEGITPWQQGRIRICLSASPLPPLPRGERLVAEADFPAEPLPLPLWARHRAPGDVIRSHGMHKKLKKLLCDHGIPPAERERLPLICYGERMTPLWYPTVAFADGFPPPGDRPAWHLRITEVVGELP